MELRDGKLIQLLKAVKENELKSLVKFVNSPYHNTNKQLLPLLQNLLSHYPSFDKKNLTKENIYRKIHPVNKPYHEGRMNLLITNLVSVIQKFFMYQEFEGKEVLQKQIQGEAFSNRNFYKNYKKEVLGLLDKMEQIPAHDEHYFYEKYKMNQAFYLHTETIVNQENSLYLINSIDNLDLFFISAKLILAAEQFKTNKKINIKSDFQFLDVIMKYVEKRGTKTPIIIRIYYYIIMLRQHGHDKRIYNNLKSSFFSNLQNLSILNQKLIFFNLISHSISILNNDKLDFRHEVFELYQLGLKQNYLINDNLITFSTYYNISALSAQIGKFDWCFEFIEKYKFFLHRDMLDQTRLLTLANSYFIKGEKIDSKYFHSTMEYCIDIKFSKKNSFYFFRSRSLWIRSCYELAKFDLSYWSTLSNYIKSFEIQLKRNSVISKEVKKRHLNSIKFIKQLVNISKNETRNSILISNLKKEFSETSIVAYKDWIKTKIGEL